MADISYLPFFPPSFVLIITAQRKNHFLILSVPINFQKRLKSLAIIHACLSLSSAMVKICVPLRYFTLIMTWSFFQQKFINPFVLSFSSKKSQLDHHLALQTQPIGYLSGAAMSAGRGTWYHNSQGSLNLLHGTFFWHIVINCIVL